MQVSNIIFESFFFFFGVWFSIFNSGQSVSCFNSIVIIFLKIFFSHVKYLKLLMNITSGLIQLDRQHGFLE